MELYQYLLIAFGVVVLLVVLFMVFKNKKIETKDYDLDLIFELLDKSNIITIEYIRNKIVLMFKDVTKFNTSKLHENGALGITIVGDKVKFYFDGGNEKNYDIFNMLKSYIER
jgi:phosphotransferase system IIB component